MATRRLPLTIDERDELLRAVRLRRNNWVTYAPYLDAIDKDLRHGRLVAADERDGIAALDTVVHLRRPGATRADAWRLVRPEDEDMSAGWLSVLSPLGWEVFGARAGETVSAPTENGLEVFVVERVMAAPAAGEMDVHSLPGVH